jgi:REP element-mobilizing transposase RayT
MSAKAENPSRDRQGAAFSKTSTAVPNRTHSGEPSTLREDECPLAYLITFGCYGVRLHGDERGSVDSQHNVPFTPFLLPNQRRQQFEEQSMMQPAYEMDEHRRSIVRDAICEVCRHRGWELLALHVRSNHVHLVVQANARPERAMNDFKSYASRRLNQARLDSSDRRRWARHGSTRYLWKEEAVEAAVHYVLHEQGEPMAVCSRLHGHAAP